MSSGISMSSAGELPQLTVKAIVLGMLLSVIMAGANAYLGLFAGLTVSASIPAAVISMGVLRLFREHNVLENNIVQTAASAGESLAAGVIFTMPALLILGYWEVFDNWIVSLIAGIGGLLGVLFTVPLRRSLIVEQQLSFPEGTATAQVLTAGRAGRRGLRVLSTAAVIGAVVKLGETGLRLWPASAQAAAYLGSGGVVAYAGTNLSPALTGVGYIVGLNIASLVFSGGLLAWLVAIPAYGLLGLPGDAALAGARATGTGAADLAFAIWSTQIRYLGVGAMLVGGLWALISIRASLWSGFRSGLAETTAGRDAPAAASRDIPMPLILLGIVLLSLPVAWIYRGVVGSSSIAAGLAVVMVVTGFLFSAVAGYMAGLVGSSNNPVSGITIATIFLTSLLLLVVAAGSSGPAAAIMVGGVVCCAAAIAGDNMQDLKAGYLLGATPWKQQLMQCVGVVSAMLFMAPILNLLLQAYGIGAPTPERPSSLLAPQATLMASVARGVFAGDLPWLMVGIGAGLGGLIIAFDEFLRRRGASFRAPVLAVAVGLYLPLELSVPIFAGGLVAHFTRPPQQAGDAPASGGILAAAGLIAGEALLGILLAVPIVLMGEPEPLAVPEALRGGSLIGLVLIALVIAWLARSARRAL